MPHFKNDESTSKDMIALRYADISKENLAHKIEDLFFSKGYKRTIGTPGNATYEKGDRTMRMLLGAFFKYFKFKVMIDDLSDGETSMRVIRATTGMSGGLIGINQVTQEMIELSQALRTI